MATVQCMTRSWSPPSSQKPLAVAAAASSAADLPYLIYGAEDKTSKRISAPPLEPEHDRAVTGLLSSYHHNLQFVAGLTLLGPPPSLVSLIVAILERECLLGKHVPCLTATVSDAHLVLPFTVESRVM